jgi:hypothetical protein
VRAEIQNILRYETVAFEEKYLGLPVPEGRMNKVKFQPLKSKFMKRASDWVEKYMSDGEGCSAIFASLCYGHF